MKIAVALPHCLEGAAHVTHPHRPAWPEEERAARGFVIDLGPADCRGWLVPVAARTLAGSMAGTEMILRSATHEEIGMGTWGTGPFDNDTAADFANDLDDASLAEREELVRGVLTRTLQATGYLYEAEEAVAAAALIAAQCPGGEPLDSVYGPEQPLPAFPQDLRELAAKALDRVSADESGLSGTWVDPADARQWLSSTKILRHVLDPPPTPIDVPLFDL